MENPILLLSRRKMMFSVNLKTTGTRDLEEKWEWLATTRICLIKDLVSQRVFRRFHLTQEVEIKKFTKIQHWKNKWCIRASSHQLRKDKPMVGILMTVLEKHSMKKQSLTWREHFQAISELTITLRNPKRTCWSTWVNFDS